MAPSYRQVLRPLQCSKPNLTSRKTAAWPNTQGLQEIFTNYQTNQSIHSQIVDTEMHETMCVCVYIHKYIYIYVYIYMYAYIQTHMYIYICTHTYDAVNKHNDKRQGAKHNKLN